MSHVNVELNARKEVVNLPVLWRLGKLFHVVPNIRRARITQDYGYVSLDLEGSAAEVDQAQSYLRGMGMLTGKADAPASSAVPESAVPQPVTIYVGLTTVNAAQGHTSLLHRVGTDYAVVVNIEQAAFDDEDGGTIDVSLSGALLEVQRAISYLHTTGLRVNPRQRCVSDDTNL